MVYESKHPLIAHKISKLREKGTIHKEFRELADEITMLLAYEAMRDLPLEPYPITTPLAETHGRRIFHDVVVVPILRAGVGMLDGLLRLLPNSHVGFLGLYRDPETKAPVVYYDKLPDGIPDPVVVIVDPMLATGGSVIASVNIIKSHGYNNIKLCTILSSPQGIAAVEQAHPDVAIFTGCIDEGLNEDRYILPGLGDAGDRLFGTP